MDVSLGLSGELLDAWSSSDPAERRQHARHTTLLQIAKISSDDFEELCILRDISSTGLRAETYWRLREGEALTVELRNGRSVPGHVVWTDGKMFGMRFEMEVAVELLLDRTPRDEKGHVSRRPRLRSHLPALLRIHGRDVPVHVRNVSQGGIGVRCEAVLEGEWPCEVALEALGNRHAIVRWYKDGEAGLALRQPLTYQEFAQWRLDLAGPLGAANDRDIAL